ncbi:hypothetical protein GOP47_0028681 [Adiantum capillus-veneris]|nr:hypothetical protein GOP47_0028681 [Adiantum capillus-veneris]
MEKRSFPSVYDCSSEGRENQAVVSEFEGTLLKSSSAVPYYMLAAWEAPAGLVRFVVLLVLWPAAWLLQRLVSESAAIRLVAWISFAGVKERDILSIARAVLPKFYGEDVHPETWRVVSSFGQRYLLTAYPRVMVESFAKDYLGVSRVLGAELQIHEGSGRATGLFVRQICPAQDLAGLHALFNNGEDVPDVALMASHHQFLGEFKEGYVVARKAREQHGADAPTKLCKPLIFHDGRLVRIPTPSIALFILLWLPFGVVLSCMRVIACDCLPVSLSLDVLRSLGVRVTVRGLDTKNNAFKSGSLFASTHRTLLDPVFISLALRRPITVVTFSLSRLSEITAPIPTIRLSRSKERDFIIMKKHLEQGDLVVCPEGTTCREPFLLRFSALFAELSTCIVPVATKCELTMFHATTARGWKGLDAFYFYLNPIPAYEITFLGELPQCLTCAGGRTSHEVANLVQSMLAATLGFKCTTFTRKDKYRALVGCDETTVVK